MMIDRESPLYLRLRKPDFGECVDCGLSTDKLLGEPDAEEYVCEDCAHRAVCDAMSDFAHNCPRGEWR